MAHQCEHWRLPCTCPTPKRVDFVINRWSFPDSLGWANFSWPWNLSRNLCTRFYQVGAWEIKIIIFFLLPIIFFLLIFGDILLLCHGVATIKTDDSVGRKVPSCKKTFFCSEDLGIAHLQCNDINREYFFFWLLACVTHLNIAWVKRIWKQRMFWKREFRSWCVEEPDFQKELKTGREPGQEEENITFLSKYLSTAWL